MEFLLVLGVLVMIALLIWLNHSISSEFYQVAVAKGHPEKKYYWYPFFLGVIGYLMIIALTKKDTQGAPAQKQEKRPASPSSRPVLQSNVRTAGSVSSSVDPGTGEPAPQPAPKSAPVLPGPDEWLCTCGRINRNYVSNCGCGKSKREVLNEQNPRV